MSTIQDQPPPPYSDSHVIAVAAPAGDVTTVIAAQNFSFQGLPTLTKHEPTATTEELSSIPLQHEVPQSPEAAAQFDTFKQNIYKHPLFPMLAMVFEKCEMSTAAPDASSHSFEEELESYMKHNKTLMSASLGDDEELNELMIKGVQVLRIHLLEMEKVSDLCQDFCARYTTCLKGKLTSETLLHVDGCDDDSLSGEPQDLSLSHSPQNGLNLSAGLNLQQQQSPSATSAVVATPTVVGGNVVLQTQPTQQTQIVSGNTVYQMVQTPQGIVAQPIQIQGPLTPVQPQVQPVIHGSTPLSQVGLPLSTSLQQQQQQQQPQQQLQLQHKSQQLQQLQADIKANNLARPLEEDEDEKSGKQKRGILPKQATQVMKSWLFQHIVHPYPTEDEKRQIAAQTNLTLLQVNNWFINARRRILQPMLEAANPDKGNKQKKPNKPGGGTKTQQRFWPVQGGGGANTAEGGDNKHDSLSNGVANTDGEGAELESDSALNPASSAAAGSTTTGYKAQTPVLQQNTSTTTTNINNNNTILAQHQQAAALRLATTPGANLHQLMSGVGGASLTADRLQQLQQQMQLATSSSLTGSTVPSAEAAAMLAQSEAAALMGSMPGSGVVFKLSPEGHLIPSVAPPPTHPLGQSGPAPLTLDNLQALQQAGLVLGSAPMPFSLPLGVAGAGLGFGLGLSPAFPGFTSQMAPSPAVSSAFPLGALNFAASPYGAPLQFANYLNAASSATPMDLSGVTGAGAGLQLGQLTGAPPTSQFNGQVLMGLHSMQQEAGSDITNNNVAEEGSSHDDGLEVGELKVDMRESKFDPGQG